MRALLLAGVVVATGFGLFQLSANAAPTKRLGFQFNLPIGFPTPRVPANNPMSQAKVEIGRRLFYDKRLSANQQQSCSSCHIQELAFTDGKTTAVGSTDQVHPRNSPSLVNVAYNASLAWANPALVTLERQMEVPVFGKDPIELGVNDRNRAVILARLKRDPWYRSAFRRAFPTNHRAIQWTTVIRTIASFQRSIISANSKYDRYLANRARLTAAEKRGLGLFMAERGECHHCHGSFIFNDQATYVGAPLEPLKFHNTGLFNIGGTGAFPTDNTGIFEITGRPQDMGRFRAPSLRNVELTAPYMHDGSIPTLRDAVEHYKNGGRTIASGPNAGDGRANPFKDPLLAPIVLSDKDVDDLVSFLATLSDRSVTTNPRFADPFAGGAER